MTSFQKGVLRSLVPLAVLAVVMSVIANAIGGWFQTLGPTVVVMGTGMILGLRLKEKLKREEENGD